MSGWLDLADKLQNIKIPRQIKLDVKLQQTCCALMATVFGCRWLLGGAVSLSPCSMQGFLGLETEELK